MICETNEVGTQRIQLVRTPTPGFVLETFSFATVLAMFSRTPTPENKLDLIGGSQGLGNPPHPYSSAKGGRDAMQGSPARIMDERLGVAAASSPSSPSLQARVVTCFGRIVMWASFPSEPN